MTDLSEYKVGDILECVTSQSSFTVGKTYQVYQCATYGDLYLASDSGHVYYRFTIAEFKLKDTKMDLTKVDKPFGELDRKTQVALFEYWLDGGKVVFMSGGQWPTVSDPSWISERIYKAKEPTKKMTVREVCSALGYDVEIVEED